MRLLSKATIIIVATSLTVGVTAASSIASSGGWGGAPRGAPANRAQFRADMRKLWEDHVTWTRLFIVDAEAGSPETTFTADRLLRNQDDIGAAIAPFYGDAAGDQLSTLLHAHILIAADLIAAAKSGADTAALAASWYANADEIADFLAAANPKNWPDAHMRQMMKDHLDLTLKEATDHLTGQFAADVADYDAVHDEILQMADMLAFGIISQFPARFA